MQPETAAVRTADNVGIGYPTAGIATRGAAFAIDAVIIGVLFFVLSLGYQGIANLAGGDSPVSTLLGAILLALLSLLVLVGYFAILEATTAGRTPGKRALGLRVLRVDGSAPGLVEALTRNIVRIIDLPGFGLVTMFVNTQSRRLGDLAAGTLVVRESSLRRRPAAWWLSQPAATPPADAGTPGIDRLGSTDLVVIRAFLQRQGLSPELRGRMAADIARRLLDRMELPPDAPERSWPPEHLLDQLNRQLGAGSWPTP